MIRACTAAVKVLDTPPFQQPLEVNGKQKCWVAHVFLTTTVHTRNKSSLHPVIRPGPFETLLFRKMFFIAKVHIFSLFLRVQLPIARWTICIIPTKPKAYNSHSMAHFETVWTMSNCGSALSMNHRRRADVNHPLNRPHQTRTHNSSGCDYRNLFFYYFSWHTG